MTRDRLRLTIIAVVAGWLGFVAGLSASPEVDERPPAASTPGEVFPDNVVRQEGEVLERIELPGARLVLVGPRALVSAIGDLVKGAFAKASERDLVVAAPFSRKETR